MSFFAEKMCKIAQSKQKRMVFPEGTEIRTQKATRILLDKKFAKEVILIGEESAIVENARKNQIDLSGVTLVDPKNSQWLPLFAKELFELRKAKGMSEAEANQKILEPLNWGCMMVRLGYADALVAGAESSTANVLRSAFQIIKTAPNVKSASSCFVMALPDSSWGHKGNLIFADCATIPNPTAEQLTDIAIQSAFSCKKYLDCEPNVAMLSFSTYGSANHENVEKVAQAVKMIKEKDPDLNVDGEMQVDAALIESVANQKAPGSPVGGKANVLIFPDLQSGNIGYKLVQRLAKAEAYGPILQGFAKPVSDLSRGCKVDDIVITACITLAQVEE